MFSSWICFESVNDNDQPLLYAIYFQEWYEQDFNWVLTETGNSVESMNSWMQDIHPKQQAPLRTSVLSKAPGSTDQQVRLAESNFNTRVCFSEAMLGWRKVRIIIY